MGLNAVYYICRLLKAAMRLKHYICIPLLLITNALFCQVKSVQATKTDRAPIIDGSLSDSVWSAAPILTGFIQNYPNTGAPATAKTEVRILYDNDAIYVGAYLYDNPSNIRKQLTARDDEGQKDVDYFSVFLDTYHDHQNGFQFLVTSQNVQTDAKLGPAYTGSFGNYGDKSWDAVWESKTKIQNDGWVVEMRIPYISLRFSKKDVQNWGLQLLRFTRNNNETCFWNAVDPQVNGFVNQFGTLTALENITPPLRLSFSPYVTTGYRSSPIGNNHVNEWLRNGGMDVKYGINESFTLDATLIPDFGQVVSDNVVNNLSPYEVKFQENRPFFTEGTELFNKAGLFYSRRVGATPDGYGQVKDFVLQYPEWKINKNPASVQLYNAAKFSGRNKYKLGIGIFNAVAAPSYAHIRNTITGKDSSILTSPLSNFNIVVVDQALKGQSYITFTNTNVMRNGSERDANVSAFDVALYDKKNVHAFQGTARYSKIWGTQAYDGYNTTLKFSKVSGKWRYTLLNNIESAQYDPNDLGFLSSPNEITYRALGSYNQTRPTNHFLYYSYSLEARYQDLYKPHAFSRLDITGTFYWIFKNFWDVTLVTQVTPLDTHDYFELRTPGRYLNYPLNLFSEISGSSDSRKRLFVRFGGILARSPGFDNDLYGISLGYRYRFSNKFSIDMQGDAHTELNQVGYAFLREANNDPIVGYRNNRDFTAVVTGIYNFTPRLNFSLRARHYWNKVNYISFHDVDSKGDLTSRPFVNGQDQNVNLFNIDAFLTWDFRFGSKIVLGYKNWLGDEEMVTTSGKNNYFRNLTEVFKLRHGNEYTVRFIYFLDYNQLRHKR